MILLAIGSYDLCSLCYRVHVVFIYNTEQIAKLELVIIGYHYGLLYFSLVSTAALLKIEIVCLIILLHSLPREYVSLFVN